VSGAADNVAVAIVSHSPEVARGAADMVRQMVGEAVDVAFTGGNPDGGLGTDAGLVLAMLERIWRPAGVLVLVDLGGAEMNAEAAIEMLAEDRQGAVRIANAAIVEGAVIGGTMASTGATLEAVIAAAEETGS
jgi:dihydroxyacetone kinase phosphotransfer subunit